MISIYPTIHLNKIQLKTKNKKPLKIDFQYTFSVWQINYNKIQFIFYVCKEEQLVQLNGKSKSNYEHIFGIFLQQSLHPFNGYNNFIK